MNPHPLSKKVSVLLLLLASSGSILSAQLEYSATAYNLVDKQGKVTAQFTSSVEGSPAFFFYDENGKTRLQVGLYPNGAPGVTLLDSEGKAAAMLRLLDENGYPALILRENGEDKKIISLGEDSELLQKSASPQTEGAAEIVTTKVKTSEERKREYLTYFLAFLFGLAGAYGGGRIAIRRDNRVALAIAEAHKRQAEGSAQGVPGAPHQNAVSIQSSGTIIIPKNTN